MIIFIHHRMVATIHLAERKMQHFLLELVEADPRMDQNFLPPTQWGGRTHGGLNLRQIEHCCNLHSVILIVCSALLQFSDFNVVFSLMQMYFLPPPIDMVLQDVVLQIHSMHVRSAGIAVFKYTKVRGSGGRKAKAGYTADMAMGPIFVTQPNPTHRWKILRYPLPPSQL